MENLRIIGTSHIAPESVKKVRKVIHEEQPAVVAVELDRKRLAALLQKGKGKSRTTWKDVRRVGLKGWLFAMLGSWIEKKLGKKVGAAPGDEMLAAIASAHEVNAKIALIDQDIEITLRKFSKALTWKEKWRFIVDVVNGLLFKKGTAIDLAKVPSQKVIEKLIKEVKVRYPNVYRVLVEERNEIMAKRLAKLHQQFPDKMIVAVVGAGHEKEMRHLLKKYLKAEKSKR